jgi:hypothetical protein
MQSTRHALIALAVLAVTGCASLGNSPAAAPSSSPDLAPSQGLCTTHACIASDVRQSLLGLVAKDDAVITRAKCQPSTVTDNQGGTWTVHCTAWYSDGSEAAGDATLIPSQQKVAWEPTDMIVPPPGT